MAEVDWPRRATSTGRACCGVGCGGIRAGSTPSDREVGLALEVDASALWSSRHYASHRQPHLAVLGGSPWIEIQDVRTRSLGLAPAGDFREGAVGGFSDGGGAVPARFRKSIKLAPGVKLNVNKKSVSLTAGTRGAHYTVSSTGRRTKSFGVPGSGVSYRSTSTARTQSSSRRRTAAPAGRVPTPSAKPLKPGLFSPKAEKVLHRALLVADRHGPFSVWGPQIDAACSDSRFAVAAHAMGGLIGLAEHPEWAVPHLAAVFATGVNPERDPFIVKYVGAVGQTLSVGGLPLAIPLSRELVGILLTAAYFQGGQADRAGEVAQALPDTAVCRLVRTDLALERHLPAEAVTLTDRLTNTDDVTALSLALRAQALREVGQLDAAIEVTKEALRFPSRASAARLRAKARTRPRLSVRRSYNKGANGVRKDPR